MKAALIALALLTASPASADVMTLQSDATDIVVGQSITFNLRFAFPDNICCATFGQDGALFLSGDGQSQSAFVTLNTGGNVAFIYLAPGNYGAAGIVHVFFDGFMWPFGGGPATYVAFENITVSVPEPPTWALLLFGFAFFGIKGIWPGAEHE